MCDGRLKGKFVSKYTINLSRRKLTENLLCKGFNFISTCNKVEVKVRIGTIGRMICAKWNFRNDQRGVPIKPFKTKSSFNPSTKDVITEI